MLWKRETADQPAPARPRDQWFWDHYDAAAGTIISIVETHGRPFASARVADIGCGDGIIDLGLALRRAPEVVTGFDVNPVDTDALLEKAIAEGVAEELPANLEFVRNKETELPVEDSTYDVVVTWSAFEHIAQPEAMLVEMRRIVRPDGVLFLQLYPFYDSEHGSHLWDWYPEGFAQLRHGADELSAQLRTSDRHPPEWTEYMLGEFATLNQVTLDGLGTMIGEAGFVVTYLHLMTNAVLPPREAAGVPLSRLGVSGVELLAVPMGRATDGAVRS